MKKTLKVGINGFGRIGRLVLRASKLRNDIEVVAINTRRIQEDYMCYLFKYDSVHRQYNGEVSFEEGYLIVDGQRIKVSMEPDPEKLNWGDMGVDVVITTKLPARAPIHPWCRLGKKEYCIDLG